MDTYNDASTLTPNPITSATEEQKVPEIFRLEGLNGLDLYEVSIADLQNYFSNGRLTSLEYVKFCLDRVHKVNPYLECVIEVNPDAIKIAAELDDERRQVGRSLEHHIFEMRGAAWEE